MQQAPYQKRRNAADDGSGKVPQNDGPASCNGLQPVDDEVERCVMESEEGYRKAESR